MPNTFNQLWVDKLQAGLKLHLEAGSMTAWMEGNAKQVEYKGGRTVTMREMTVDGLGDYDRTLGYPRGAITGSKYDFQMVMDRGREFILDVADQDETGFIVTAATIMREFQANHVIPEVDAYRIAKIYAEVLSRASGQIDDTAVDDDALLDTLLTDIDTLRDEYLDSSTPVAIIMSGVTQGYFDKNFIRGLEYQSFQSGSINTKVRQIDGNPLLIMPSRRLKSAYDFYDGITGGQTDGGFVPAAGAEDILWMVVPWDAPIAVSKIDQLRVFTPLEYQQMHAWKVDYRMFHDLWLPTAQAEKCFIRTGDITITT